MLLGIAHKRLDSPRPRSLIGEVERTLTGNIVLRVGRENEVRGQDYGWHQTEHVVLTQEEARELRDALSEHIVPLT